MASLRATPHRLVTVALLAPLLASCASTPRESARGDPLEPVNRQVHAFNDGFDRAIFRPIARGYQKVTPDPVQQGIGNFFSNLGEITVFANSILQAKGRKATATTLRFAFNSTFGLLGVLDLAGWIGLEKQDEDFGQTLGYWGLGPGPYVVLPFLGPSSVRDTSGMLVDEQYDLASAIADDDATFYAMRVLSAIDTRAGLLGASRMLDTAAVDPYAFTRQAYLRRRADKVHDGDPPPEILPGSGDRDSDGGDDFDPFADDDDDLFREDEGAAGDSGS